MKKIIAFGSIVFLWFFFAGNSQAQFPRFGGMQAMRMFAPFASGFNPQTIVKISGKIKKMTNVKDKMIPTVAAILGTGEGEEYEVQLGPMMFIQNMRNFRFKKGTEVEVIGSQLEGNDKREVILAMKIIIDGKETLFRDQMGIPVWSPMYRRRGGTQSSAMPGMMGGGMMGGGMMGGGMMGGGGAQGNVQRFPGNPDRQVQMSNEGNLAEDAEDIQGGKVPGGYRND